MNLPRAPVIAGLYLAAANRIVELVGRAADLWLARWVGVPSMLYAMDQDDLVVLDDLIDDPVVPSPSRVQSFELSQQGLPQPVRVVCDWAENRCECCLSYLLGQQVQVLKTLGCDFDLIHVRSLDMFLERQLLTASCLIA